LGGARSRRVALFTPLPPAETGTADYAAALISELRKLVDLQVFERVPLRFRPAAFDASIYQLGNNPHHAEIYRMALKHPGVVVLHEANLGDLIRGITSNDEAAYSREVIYEIFGHELEKLPDPGLIEAGPQPRSFTMLRRVLSRSTGCIVHSHSVADEVRRAGFRGKIGRIPHGAQVQRIEGAAWRSRLGIAPDQPVVGMFGYQRPDKQACDCLLVFHQILRRFPGARLLIAGKPHPEVPIEERIAALGLHGNVHDLGFQTLADFDGLIAACDVVLNLRYPTFEETSGTMMRAFGLGKTVVISDNCANRDLPDNICVKIPVDEFQGRVLEECLLWLLADRAITSSIGEAARQWVADTCTWERVARSYADFLFPPVGGTVSSPVSLNGHAPEFFAEYLNRWAAPESPGYDYLSGHLARLVKTLGMIPRGADNSRILEMGCYLQITPALRNLLGYGEVRGCYEGCGGSERRVVHARDGEPFECEIDLFDAEVDPFPYAGGHFDTVLCCELLAHLSQDPMRMMNEIHRILKPGGILVLTTPNAASLRAADAILKGKHPALYNNRYPRPPAPSPEALRARHVREYTPGELVSLLCDSGFVVTRIETGRYGSENFPDVASTRDLLARCGRSVELRDDCIFAAARKAAIPKNRYPSWLYDD